MIFTYGYRVNKILNNEGKTAYFRTREIVSAIVNLMDAQRVLSEEEFKYVYAIYKLYSMVPNKILLSKSGFLELSSDIMAHFDLVAPYYKFCGNSNMKLMILEEGAKREYRKRAKEIINHDKMFGEEWMDLHKEFVKRFYDWN